MNGNNIKIFVMYRYWLVWLINTF